MNIIPVPLSQSLTVQYFLHLFVLLVWLVIINPRITNLIACRENLNAQAKAIILMILVSGHLLAMNFTPVPLPQSLILQFFLHLIILLVLEIVIDSCCQLIRYLNDGENVNALTEALLKIMNDIIMFAETPGQKRTPEADNLLKRVGAEAGEIYEMKEACRRRTRVLGVPLNWVSTYKDGKRATEKAEVVDKLRFEANSTVIARSLPPSSVQKRLLVGMESYVNDVLLHLDDDSVGIIAIRGMGGVGKTTLLNEVNSCFHPGSGRNSEFDHVIWTVASRGCTLEKLQKGIAESLGLDLEAYALPPDVVLFEYLKNKNFLLLLDDLWRGFKLEDVRIPHPGTGGNQYKRKVIFTTRLQDMCDKMTVNAEIKMNCLDETDALGLFNFHVGEQTLKSHPDIPDLAGVVAKKCRGLPLALKAIGTAMGNEKKPEHWRRVIELLQDSKQAEIQKMEILEEEGEEREMFRILELSYTKLPDDRMRQCFLSCCLWPENHRIKKAELLDCWMGLGLIDTLDGILFQGHEYIRILEEACLLEPADHTDFVRMHDLIRDFALWIASDYGRKRNNWIVQAGVGLKEAKDVKQKWIEAEAAERISLMSNYIEMSPQYLPGRPSLKVLMLQMNRSLGWIPPDFFQCMPALTYLDLSHTILEELPKEISILVQLQYLNLSQTCIKELPQELACLKELKYLLLRYTIDLWKIPHGAMSNLSKLQQLDLFGTNYKGWEVEGSRGCGNEENTASLEELEELNSKVFRTNLGITVEGVPTLQMLSRLGNIPTRYLCIKCMCGSTSIQWTPSIVKAQLGSLQMLKSLRKLMIKSCQSLVELEVDGEAHDRDGDWQLRYLQDLHLRRLMKLKAVKWTRLSIPYFLPHLRSVTIDCCYELENANWVLLLPQLKALAIVFCPKMRHVIDDSISSHVGYKRAPSFNYLQKLLLHELRSLTSICDQAIRFPSLRVIDIEDCDELKQLPNTIKEHRLLEIRGSEGWWQSLQWKDERMKALLLRCFRRKY